MVKKIVFILCSLITGICLCNCVGTSDVHNTNVEPFINGKALQFENNIIAKHRKENSNKIISDDKIFAQVGHSDRVPCVIFSPDGKFILSGSPDMTLKLWDTKTGREVRTFAGHTDSISVIAFSPGGKLVLSAAESRLILWDAETGQEIWAISMERSFLFSALTFSQDSRYILASIYNHHLREYPFKILDTQTGREIKTFPGHAGTTGLVYSVAISPNGNYYISGSADHTIKLWDVRTGREIRTFYGHKSSVKSIAFSPDGKSIISGGDVDVLKLWDVQTGRVIKTFDPNVGFSWSAESVAFSPDGNYIVSGGGSLYGDIKIWDINTGREIKTFSRHKQAVSSLAFSPDGKQILSSSKFNEEGFKLWDVDTGKEIRTFLGNTNAIKTMAISPDGKQIIVSQNNRTLKLLDVVTGIEIKTFKHTSNVNSVAFSPNGKMFVSGSVLKGSEGKSVKLWDIKTGNEIRTFSGYNFDIASVAFSPNGKYILASSGLGYSEEHRSIKLWDIETGNEIISFSGHESWGGTSVIFSPNGRYVLSGGLGYANFILWETATGRRLSTYPKDMSQIILSLAFSPDGKYILSGSDRGGSLTLWDITTATKIRSHEGHPPQGVGLNEKTIGGAVNSVAFSPDGKFYVSGSRDRTIKLWDTATGSEIKTFIGHTDDVTSVTFTSNGKNIISASKDGSVRFWDTTTGEEIAQIVSYSGSDTQIIAASRALTVEVIEQKADISSEWICITPDGYYTASPRGDRYLNVRAGNQVTGIDSFREMFYNPGIVEARLTGRPDPVTKRIANIQNAASFFPSIITLQTPSKTATSGSTNLAVSIVDDNQSIQNIKIFVNGNLVGGNELQTISVTQGLQAERASLTVTDQKSLSFNITLALDPGENLIEVVSYNGYAESRQSTIVNWQTSAGYRPPLPNLWILAVGVNQYTENSIRNLNFCANDAREIVNSFKAQEGRRYAKVNALLIADGENIVPSQKNIREGFLFLDKAGPRDIILLFMAGHGVNGKDGMFNFLPGDAILNHDGTMTNIITGDEIAKILETPGKRLIFIDACHSGGIDNNRMTRQLMNTNAYVFTSSKGNELSLELAELQHGVFSYSIMDTMRNSSAQTIGSLSVIGLSGNVSIDVPRRTNNRQNPVGYSLGFYDFIIVE